jgi:ABC-type molybdate transport system substrate-binding protein
MARHPVQLPRIRHFGQRGSIGLAAAIVFSLLVAGVAGVLFKGHVLGDRCTGGVRVLSAAVTPEMAPVVTQVAKRAAQDAGGCWRAKVTARSSADVLQDLRLGATNVDVWIPDSSMWVQLATRSGVRIASEAGPLAMSPVVLAMPAPAAKKLGWPDRALTTDRVLATGATSHPLAIGWPDPQRSALASAALLEFKAAASHRADGRMDLAGLMSLATATIEPSSGQARRNGLAVPLAEQSVWTDNTTSVQPLIAAYSDAPGSSLDYPLVVTNSSPATTKDAADLLAALTSEPGQLLLRTRGFRDPAGHAGAALHLVRGLEPSADVSLQSPSMADLSTARSMLGTLGHGSRLLAVVDVSGSMADPVPGSEQTRLGLTIQAASAGLGLLPAQSEAGLWEFSTNLEPGTDYRELVPLGPVEGRHAARLAGHLAGLRPIPTGSTGLYDTVLAAVQRVRSGYDPTKTNAVVLLTDGANHDAHGIGLAGLLDRLRATDDPSMPVPVISIAYGPDSDAASLRAISDVTGGTTYVAADPRTIRSVLLDAIGQRLCRPDCAKVQ